MTFDFDDFGITQIISDQCQTRDCRDALLVLKEINPHFKVTLFAVPAAMTIELLEWCNKNRDWVEIAVHGWNHHSNYESLQWAEGRLRSIVQLPVIQYYFAKGFKAPGWQISDACYSDLVNAGFWIADQEYNDDRRPRELPVYKVGRDSWHGHTWDCVDNGIYETFDRLKAAVHDCREFKFVSESLWNPQ